MIAQGDGDPHNVQSARNGIRASRLVMIDRVTEDRVCHARELVRRLELKNVLVLRFFGYVRFGRVPQGVAKPSGGGR
jgi:hypothetical protein